MSILKHKAIYELYPEVSTIKNDVAYDSQNNVIKYDTQKVNELAQQKEYISKRLDAYPSIGDQLDMLWHSINSNEPIDQNSSFFIAVKSVKDKYPKA